VFWFCPDGEECLLITYAAPPQGPGLELDQTILADVATNLRDTLEWPLATDPADASAGHC
jgi:hypothetical protein